MKKMVFIILIIISASCVKKEGYSVENKASNESSENNNSYLLNNENNIYEEPNDSINNSIIAFDNGNEKNDLHEITREFKFIAPFVNDATITIIDRTKGDTDLETRGIYQKIHDGINSIRATGFFFKFLSVYDTNNKKFVIYVDGGAFYEHGNVKGYDVSFHQDYIIANDVDAISNDIFNAVYDDMTAPNRVPDPY